MLVFRYYKKILWVLIFCLIISCASKEYELNNQGVDLAKKGKYDQAIKKFHEVLETAPEWKEPYINLAKSYLLKNELKLASKYAKQAEKLDSKDIEIQLLLINTYFLLKEHEKGQVLLKNLIKKYPQNHILYIIHGDYFSSKHDWQQAIESYKKAAELKPNLDHIYVKLGKSYLYKEIDNAKLKLPVTISENSNKAYIMKKINNILTKRKVNLDRSKTAFRKALYINQKNFQAHTMLGLLAFYSASYEEAELEFKEALKLKPENGFLNMALALNCQQLKKFREAGKFLEKAIQILPNQRTPKILQIFLEIDKRNYGQAIEFALKLINELPEVQPELFETFAHHPEQHVPWLILNLDNEDKKKAVFSGQALSSISKKPFSLDKKVWKAWWQNFNRLRQKD